MDSFTISIAATRKAVKWEQKEVSWAQFRDRCSEFAEGKETYEDYMAMSKARQDELKDVGGFVGGALKDGLRRRGHCVSRRLITLDMDNCSPGTTETWLSQIRAQGFLCLVYSTRKHSPDKPRLRAVFLADRDMTADEYQATARALAQMIDPLMRVFDPTTFEAERLMYWPSVSKGATRVFWSSSPVMEVPPVPVDDILVSTYADWTDCTSWPVCEREESVRASNVDKQQNPTEKPGIVGAFCRVYDVPQAIDTFLSEVYIECGPARYTYAGGSTTGGAVLYDNGAFLYSHHATDPAGGKLCNAWDLVRLHRYGDLDADSLPGTPTNRLPSFTAMCRLAEQDQAVGELLAAERLEAATQDFPQADEETDPTAPPEASDDDWMDKLARDKHGKLFSTVQNLRLIMEHDPRIRGRFWVDRFAQRLKCQGPFPWPGASGERGWKDTDDAGMRWYLETTYHVTGVNKVIDAVNLTAERHAKDPVVDYLDSLEWDGEARVDRLFIDYLGAEDTEYVRAATRKMLVAAVARIMRPGCKFDQMLILSGAQGIGKSTLLHRLGRDWFTDSICSFSGKDARESVQGVWIVELGELTALDKSEVEAVKQFVSQQEDWFRVAYGRRTEQYPRRCVFFGTSNKDAYLRDTTGNRRFWPIDVGKFPPKKSVFDDLTEGEVDQIWAEAVQLYDAGEPLYLDRELTKAAEDIQEAHREDDPWEGLIQEYLDEELPEDWDNWTHERRSAWRDGMVPDRADITTKQRDKACVAEIWCELLGQDKSRLDIRTQRRIGQILSAAPGWEKSKGTARFGIYGIQKAWRRKPSA